MLVAATDGVGTKGETVMRLGTVVACSSGGPRVAYEGRLDLAW